MGMMDKYNFFEIMDEYESEDALIDQICDDQLEQSDIDFIKMRTLQKIGGKKMKKGVNKGLLGAAAAVLLLAVGTGGYCKTNDITFTQLFTGKQGEAVQPTETPTPTEQPVITEMPKETQESTETADVVEQETTKEPEKTDVSQAGTKELSVSFGDTEISLDGNLKENLKQFEKNGIIALIGENYYLGSKKLDKTEVKGVFKNRYNEEKGCYEKVMTQKPVYGNLPIVEVKAYLIDEKSKKEVVTYDISAYQMSAISCFPTWNLKKEENSEGSIAFTDYPKESYVIKMEDEEFPIGCGAIISDGTIVDVSKYEKTLGKEYTGNFWWQKEYMSLPSVQALSVAAEEQYTKYMNGKIKSLSFIQVWGNVDGNITVSTYGTEGSWKVFQKMFQE